MEEIYYVEDDSDIAELVRKDLEGHGYQVCVLHSVASAKEALSAHLPDLMVVDWNLPDGTGIDLGQWIRQRSQSMPMMFLTVHNDAADMVRGLDLGADDYVTKPFELVVLRSRIKALLRRSQNNASSAREDACPMRTCGDIRLDVQQQRVWYQEEEIILSLSEYLLLQHLMENQGRTLTRAWLLDTIWDGTSNPVNDNTLTVTMRRLRQKLQQPACIKTIRSFGYRMDNDAE